MELLCSFTTWPSAEAIDEPIPPFPDIPGQSFFDLADTLAQAKKALGPDERALFEESYQQIFAPFWDGFEEEESDDEDDEEEDEAELPDEDSVIEVEVESVEELSTDTDGPLDPDDFDYEDAPVVFSPDECAAISASARKLSTQKLRAAVNGTNVAPDYWSEDMFFSVLADVVETFSVAGERKLGVAIDFI